MNKSIKRGLLLTPAIFSSLLNELMKLFQEEFHIKVDGLKDYQLYGFNQSRPK